MADPRVALAADESALLQHVQSHLRECTGQTAHADTYAAIDQQLTCDSDGLLLLGVSTLAEQAQAKQLVQRVVLQRWPAVVVLLDALGPASRLAPLDRYVSRRIAWPEDAALLTVLVKELDRGRQFRFAGEPHANGHGHSPSALEDMLSRRLLALTPSLLPLVDRIALAASHDVTVLINGETGTGKTYLARLMHDYSPRHHHRFLAIPCGAISANLIESEFFGHVKGSFTGADRTKIGKFAAAGE